MPRPRNPDAHWNRLDGAHLPPPLVHAIEDIRMRPGECWVKCTCGWYAEAAGPEDRYTEKTDFEEVIVTLPNGTGLREQYASHIADTKNQPLLEGGASWA